MSFAQINQMGGLMAAPQRPANPFADNADYMALQEYQRSLGPTEDELARLRELQTAFTSSDAYQSHQQEQQQRQQMMQMQRGIMGQAPMQMQRQVPMMRHPMQQGGYGGGFGHQQMGNNTMQMLVALLSQAFAGGGQQMGGGYGSQQAYGQMPQRQLGVMPSVGQATFEGPTANRGGYINQLGAAQPQNMQQAVYAQPQQASPFGGAARGYYA
jgi:hypothetical protein